MGSWSKSIVAATLRFSDFGVTLKISSKSDNLHSVLRNSTVVQRFCKNTQQQMMFKGGT